MRSSRDILIVACVIACVAACGAAQPEPATPTSPPANAPGTAPPAAPGAAKSWNDMKHEERLALMKTAVLPKMSTAFQAVDPERFKDFTCVTCHGNRIKEGNFDMPNPDLPKLDPKDSFKKHMDTKPAITKFMMTQVVPEMASTLGIAPYDPATHTGFGCTNCHTMEK